MSNKTQLQANNTQLASLIQTLQGKAAGGGSSGGGIGSICTVNISTNGPSMNVTFYYMDSDLNVLSMQKSGMELMEGFTMDVPAYSPIAISSAFSMTRITGDIIRVFASCYYVMSDGSIILGT